MKVVFHMFLRDEQESIISKYIMKHQFNKVLFTLFQSCLRSSYPKMLVQFLLIFLIVSTKGLYKEIFQNICHSILESAQEQLIGPLPFLLMTRKWLKYRGISLHNINDFFPIDLERFQLFDVNIEIDAKTKITLNHFKVKVSLKYITFSSSDVMLI